MELNAALQAAVWWSTILLLKLATFGPIVGFTRTKRKVVANEEDAKFKGGATVSTSDPVVERSRR